MRALPYTCGPVRDGGKTPKGKQERNCNNVIREILKGEAVFRASANA